MLIKTGSREDAIRALINTWLKMPGKRCATCGKSDMGEIAECASENNPCLVGTNKDILDMFFKHDIRMIREQRKNKWACNDSKTIRYAVTIPQDLYTFLDVSMQRLYNEKLFSEKYNQLWFARKFPMFSVPEEL